jgi:pyruvate/2-oxoglutarate/acetoin dehydrogenase E1 component
MGKYMDELTRSMEYLGKFDNTIFIGQSVEVAGTAMRNTLLNIDDNKLVEMPVDEDFQMGLATGMALTGLIPISIFPRWNFLLLATNQIVNHLDKLKEITNFFVDKAINELRSLFKQNVPDLDFDALLA